MDTELPSRLGEVLAPGSGEPTCPAGCRRACGLARHGVGVRRGGDRRHIGGDHPLQAVADSPGCRTGDGYGTIPRRRDREPTGEGRGFTRLLQREEFALHGGGGRMRLRTPVGRYPRRGGPGATTGRSDEAFVVPSRHIPGALVAHSDQSLASRLSAMPACRAPGPTAPGVTRHTDREALA